MSEKSIPRRRRIRRPLFPARPPRADDTDAFAILSPPHGVGHDEHTTGRRAPQSQESRLLGRVTQIRAIQGIRVTEHRRRLALVLDERSAGAIGPLGSICGRRPCRASSDTGIGTPSITLSSTGRSRVDPLLTLCRRPLAPNSLIRFRVDLVCALLKTSLPTEEVHGVFVYSEGHALRLQRGQCPRHLHGLSRYSPCGRPLGSRAVVRKLISRLFCAAVSCGPCGGSGSGRS